MKDLKFYETYLLENVQYLASLERKTLIDIIKNNNNPDDDSSYNYVESLLIYFKRIIRYDAELQITYKFSEGCTEGRLYSNGLSFQSIPDNISLAGWISANISATFLTKICFIDLR